MFGVGGDQVNRLDFVGPRWRGLFRLRQATGKRRRLVDGWNVARARVVRGSRHGYLRQRRLTAFRAATSEHVGRLVALPPSRDSKRARSHPILLKVIGRLWARTRHA